MLSEHLSPVQGSQTTAPVCCMCRVWRVASVRPATAAVAATNPSRKVFSDLLMRSLL